MTKSERSQIIKWASTKTNEELEKEYYDSVFDCLGSEVDEMYERGWDMQDIIEREKYEKYLGQKSDILMRLCEERGIKLWGNYQENNYEVNNNEEVDENDIPF